MNPKHPAIDRIEGPHDNPVAWTKVSEPRTITLGTSITASGPHYSTTGQSYNIAIQYAIPIEPYAEAILEPESEVFV